MPSRPAGSDAGRAASNGNRPAPPSSASHTRDVKTSPAAADASLEPAQTESVTYGEDDVDVTPPLVVSPQLLGMLAQSSPGNRPDVMTIAIVVNESGTVDSVQAVNIPVSIGESVMLTAALSAVKAWHFHPALRDGAPVRYRQIVPLRVADFTP